MHYIAAALLFLFSFSASAQVGASFLAAQGFDKKECNAALKVFEGIENPAIAILWGTFTTRNLCLQEFLARYAEKQKHVEIHFSNEAGRKQGRLRAGELKTLSKKNIARRTEKIASFIEKYGPVKTSWYVSLGLEDYYARKTVKRICRSFRARMPIYVNYVRNGVVDSYLGCAQFIELHRYDAKIPRGKPCIFNGDGHDVNFGDGRFTLEGRASIQEMSSALRGARKRGCIVLAWWAGPQGIGRRFVEPRRRRFRIYSSHVSTVNKILREIE